MEAKYLSSCLPPREARSSGNLALLAEWGPFLLAAGLRLSGLAWLPMLSWSATVRRVGGAARTLSSLYLPVLVHMQPDERRDAVQTADGTLWGCPHIPFRPRSDGQSARCATRMPGRCGLRLPGSLGNPQWAKRRSDGWDGCRWPAVGRGGRIRQGSKEGQGEEKKQRLRPSSVGVPTEICNQRRELTPRAVPPPRFHSARAGSLILTPAPPALTTGSLARSLASMASILRPSVMGSRAAGLRIAMRSAMPAFPGREPCATTRPTEAHASYPTPGLQPFETRRPHRKSKRACNGRACQTCWSTV